MITQKVIQNKVPFTVLIIILVALHITWDYFHGGVPTHYILHDENMPGISNWWTLLTIPLITFILLSLIQKNYKKDPNAEKLSKITNGFIGGLFFGVLLSVLWVIELQSVMIYAILLPIIMSLFIPVHLPGNLLGLILGLTYIFGGVLPLGIGLFLFIASFLVWLIFRKIIPFIFLKIFK